MNRANEIKRKNKKIFAGISLRNHVRNKCLLLIFKMWKKHKSHSFISACLLLMYSTYSLNCNSKINDRCQNICRQGVKVSKCQSVKNNAIEASESKIIAKVSKCQTHTFTMYIKYVFASASLVFFRNRVFSANSTVALNNLIAWFCTSLFSRRSGNVAKSSLIKRPDKRCLGLNFEIC